MTEKMYIPGKVVSVSSASRGNYNGLELKYVTNKSGKEITDFVFGSTLKANPTLADILKSLKPGDPIKTQKEKKGKYTNLVAVYRDDGTSSKSTGTRHTSSSNVDFNTRAARGQALNLAVTVAVAEGKHNDDSFILSQIDRFIKLGEMVQRGDSVKSAEKVTEDDNKQSGVEDFFA